MTPLVSPATPRGDAATPGDATDPSARIHPLLTWPPRADVPAEARRRPFGVSLSAASPERADWATAPRAALVYRHRRRAPATFAAAIEVGPEKDASTSYDLMVLRSRAVLAGAMWPSRGLAVQPVYELGLAHEWASVEAADASIDRFAVFCALGLETGPRSGAWSVTVGCAALVGSSRFESETSGGVTYRF